MKTIQSITVTAVVLMFVLSAFAGTAAAAHDPKDPEHDNLFPDSTFDGEGNENFPDSVFDEKASKPTSDEMFPDSVFDERVGHLIGPNRLNENVPDDKFPGADWDEKSFPGSDWDGDDAVEEGPEIQG